MTTHVPEAVQWLFWIVAGESWPEGDEDALRRMAHAWHATADSINEVIADGNRGSQQVKSAMEGQTADAFAKLWAQIGEGGEAALPKLRDACKQLGDSCDETALELEHTKLMIIMALVVLAVTIAVLIANTIDTLGASDAAIPLAQMGTRQVCVMIFKQLVQKLATKAATVTLQGALRGIAFQTGVSALMEGGAQGIEIAEGHRHGFDGVQFGGALAAGAAGGVAGQGFGRVVGSRFGGSLAKEFGKAAVDGAVQNTAGGIAQQGVQHAATGQAFDWNQVAKGSGQGLAMGMVGHATGGGHGAEGAGSAAKSAAEANHAAEEAHVNIPTERGVAAPDSHPGNTDSSSTVDSRGSGSSHGDGAGQGASPGSGAVHDTGLTTAEHDSAPASTASQSVAPPREQAPATGGGPTSSLPSTSSGEQPSSHGQQQASAGVPQQGTAAAGGGAASMAGAAGEGLRGGAGLADRPAAPPATGALRDAPAAGATAARPESGVASSAPRGEAPAGPAPRGEAAPTPRGETAGPVRDTAGPPREAAPARDTASARDTAPPRDTTSTGAGADRPMAARSPASAGGRPEGFTRDRMSGGAADRGPMFERASGELPHPERESTGVADREQPAHESPRTPLDRPLNGEPSPRTASTGERSPEIPGRFQGNPVAAERMATSAEAVPGNAEGVRAETPPSGAGDVPGRSPERAYADPTALPEHGASVPNGRGPEAGAMSHPTRGGEAPRGMEVRGDHGPAAVEGNSRHVGPEGRPGVPANAGHRPEPSAPRTAEEHAAHERAAHELSRRIEAEGIQDRATLEDALRLDGFDDVSPAPEVPAHELRDLRPTESSTGARGGRPVPDTSRVAGELRDVLGNSTVDGGRLLARLHEMHGDPDLAHGLREEYARTTGRDLVDDIRGASRDGRLSFDPERYLHKLLPDSPADSARPPEGALNVRSGEFAGRIHEALRAGDGPRASELLDRLSRDPRKIWELGDQYRSQFGAEVTDHIRQAFDGPEGEYLHHLLGGEHFETHVLSLDEAKEVYDRLGNSTFRTRTGAEVDIPFGHPEDGCYDRAHRMAMKLTEWGYSNDKVYAARPGASQLRVMAETAKYGTPDRPGAVEWGYHVAPIIKVRHPSGNVFDVVMDPSLGRGPLALDEWVGMMGVNRSNYLRFHLPEGPPAAHEGTLGRVLHEAGRQDRPPRYYTDTALVYTTPRGNYWPYHLGEQHHMAPTLRNADVTSAHMQERIENYAHESESRKISHELTDFLDRQSLRGKNPVLDGLIKTTGKISPRLGEIVEWRNLGGKDAALDQAVDHLTRTVRNDPTYRTLLDDTRHGRPWPPSSMGFDSNGQWQHAGVMHRVYHNLWSEHQRTAPLIPAQHHAIPHPRGGLPEGTTSHGSPTATTPEPRHVNPETARWGPGQHAAGSHDIASAHEAAGRHIANPHEATSPHIAPGHTGDEPNGHIPSGAAEPPRHAPARVGLPPELHEKFGSHIEVHQGPNGVSFGGTKFTDPPILGAKSFGFHAGENGTFLIDGKPATPEQAAKVIAATMHEIPTLRELPENERLVLTTCRDSAHPGAVDELARKVSTATGRDVEVPSSDTWVGDGHIYTSQGLKDASGALRPNLEERPGSWKTITPDGKETVRHSPYPRGHASTFFPDERGHVASESRGAFERGNSHGPPARPGWPEQTPRRGPPPPPGYGPPPHAPGGVPPGGPPRTGPHPPTHFGRPGAGTPNAPRGPVPPPSGGPIRPGPSGPVPHGPGGPVSPGWQRPTAAGPHRGGPVPPAPARPGPHAGPPGARPMPPRPEAPNAGPGHQRPVDPRVSGWPGAGHGPSAPRDPHMPGGNATPRRPDGPPASGPQRPPVAPERSYQPSATDRPSTVERGREPAFSGDAPRGEPSFDRGPVPARETHEPAVTHEQPSHREVSSDQRPPAAEHAAETRNAERTTSEEPSQPHDNAPTAEPEPPSRSEASSAGHEVAEDGAPREAPRAQKPITDHTAPTARGEHLARDETSPQHDNAPATEPEPRSPHADRPADEPSTTTEESSETPGPLHDEPNRVEEHSTPAKPDASGVESAPREETQPARSEATAPEAHEPQDQQHAESDGRGRLSKLLDPKGLSRHSHEQEQPKSDASANIRKILGLGPDSSHEHEHPDGKQSHHRVDPIEITAEHIEQANEVAQTPHAELTGDGESARIATPEEIEAFQRLCEEHSSLFQPGTREELVRRRLKNPELLRGLNDAEVSAVMTYTGDRGSCFAMNEGLRNGDAGRYEPYRVTLDSALNKMRANAEAAQVTVPSQFGRNISIHSGDLAKFRFDYGLHNSVTEKGFLSCTPGESQHRPKGLETGWHKVKMTYLPAPGQRPFAVDVSHLSRFEGEGEWLGVTDRNFQVKHYAEHLDAQEPYIEVVLQETPPPSTASTESISPRDTNITRALSGQESWRR